MYPREKFLTYGGENLTDADLIAVLLNTGSKGVSFLELSKKVLAYLKDNLSNDDKENLKGLVGIHGVGSAKAVKILCGIELGRRLYCSDKTKAKIASSHDAYEHIKDIAYKKSEHVMALFLNARYELLGKQIIRIGTVNITSILPRDVIIPALEYNAVSVILSHNHPSGDPTPSKDDHIMTAKLKQAFDLVGFVLLDHIVVAGGEWESVLQ